MSATRLASTAALLAALAVPGVAADGDFHWQGTIAAGKAIEIKGVNGSIDATPAAGSQVEVVAVKRARRSDPASVEIKAVEHAGGVTLCAVYPSTSASRPNECAPGHGGRMETHDNDVQVDFAVRVPKGVAFVGRTVNGGVEAEGLDGDAEADTVNGNVRVSIAGVARAETVNGSVTASLGRADWTGDVDFKSVNGSVTVELPASAGVEVSASTVNGSIETDFPLLVQGKVNSRRLSGTIGSGGRRLALETVNGSIHLEKK